MRRRGGVESGESAAAAAPLCLPPTPPALFFSLPQPKQSLTVRVVDVAFLALLAGAALHDLGQV